jgi:hypothetical protein
MIKNESNAIITIPDGMPIAHSLLVISLSLSPVFGNFGVVVLVGDEVAKHVAPVIVLVSNVTAPVCAKALPFKVAPVSKVTDVSAKILPMRLVVVPRVAELPTLHHTLHGSLPVTDEPVDVVSDDAALKIQTPDPERVKFPVSKKLPAEQ